MPPQYHSHCIDCPFEHAAHLDDQWRICSTPLRMEDNDASVLLIFQAPGEIEWGKGRPVISQKRGSAGVRLERAFKNAGRVRTDYNITNTVQCFPGKRANGRDAAPSTAVRQHCANWLRQDIEARTYKSIVVFGRCAEKSVRALGYSGDPRFRFVKHPAGGISNEDLAKAVSYTK